MIQSFFSDEFRRTIDQRVTDVPYDRDHGVLPLVVAPGIWKSADRSFSEETINTAQQMGYD